MPARQTANRLFVICAVVGVVVLLATVNVRLTEAMARAEVCSPLCVSAQLLLD